MSKQTWVETLTVMQGAGNNVNTSTTYNSLISPQARLVFPAGYFDTPGKTIKIIAGGTLSTNASAESLVFVANLNSINVFSYSFTLASLARATPTTPAVWYMDLNLVCQTVGNSSSAAATTFLGVGALNLGTTGLVANCTTIPAVGTLAAGLAVDAQSANTLLDFGVAWSVSNANNQIKCNAYIVQALN